jgi:uncharacterized glyoxalase superfamily protein PhnB
VKWLAKAFGFKPIGEQMVRDGKVAHASMTLGGAEVMMGWPGPKYKNPKLTRHGTGCLYVTVDDVDRIFRRAKKAGGKVLEEPKNTDYGACRCGIEDPEGHQWYFARPLKPRGVRGSRNRART